MHMYMHNFIKLQHLWIDLHFIIGIYSIIPYLFSNMASCNFSFSLAHVWLCFLLLASDVLQSPKLRAALSTAASACFLARCWFSDRVRSGLAESSNIDAPSNLCVSARDSISEATALHASFNPPTPSLHALDNLLLSFDKFFAYCISASDLKQCKILN